MLIILKNWRQVLDQGKNECKIKTGYYLSFKTENLNVTKMKDSICLFIKQFEGHLFVIANIFGIEEYSIIKSVS